MSVIKVKYKANESISEFSVSFPDDDEEIEEKPLEDSRQSRSDTGQHLDEAMSRASRRFVHAGESHLYIVPFIMTALLGLAAKIINTDLRNLLEEHGSKISEEDGEIDFELALENSGELAVVLSGLDSVRYATDGYAKSLIVQLSTSFDILVSKIVEQIVVLKPSVLDASDRKVDFVDIKKYENIEELKQFFIDKTIDTVVRKSRSDQFGWMTDKLGIPLNKNLDGWCDFIEINERRNLFTHTEGNVTKEYIENCIAAGCKQESLGKLGDKLSADFDYLKRASELFFIVGVKLLQVVWRKLIDDFCGSHYDQADASFVATTYELNRSHKYLIASELGKFACIEVIKRYSSEKYKRVMFINYAVALMLQGKHRDAQSVLDRLDWEVVSHEFAICAAAIRGDVEKVCSLMPQAVGAQVLTKSFLQEWPAFFEVRKDARFTSTFERIFSEKFVGKTSAKNIDAAQRKEIAKQMKGLKEISRALIRDENKKSVH